MSYSESSISPLFLWFPQVLLDYFLLGQLLSHSSRSAANCQTIVIAFLLEGKSPFPALFCCMVELSFSIVHIASDGGATGRAGSQYPLFFLKMLMSFFPEVQRFQKGEEEEGRGGRLSISPWVASQKAFISILSFPSFLSEKKRKR